MKRITVFSGKGGTGKSTISSSLAVMLSKKYKIITVDCDVDAPNQYRPAKKQNLTKANARTAKNARTSAGSEQYNGMKKRTSQYSTG